MACTDNGCFGCSTDVACGDWHKIVNQIETAKLSGVEKRRRRAEQSFTDAIGRRTHPFPDSAGDSLRHRGRDVCNTPVAPFIGSSCRPVKAGPVIRLRGSKKMAWKPRPRPDRVHTPRMEQASHAYARAAACSRNLSNQRATQCQTAHCVAGSRELQERSDARPGISEIFPPRIALSKRTSSKILR